MLMKWLEILKTTEYLIILKNYCWFLSYDNDIVIMFRKSHYLLRSHTEMAVDGVMWCLGLLQNKRGRSGWGYGRNKSIHELTIVETRWWIKGSSFCYSFYFSICLKFTYNKNLKNIKVSVLWHHLGCFTLGFFFKELIHWQPLFNSLFPILAGSCPQGLPSCHSFPVPFIISFAPMAFITNHMLTNLKCESPSTYRTLATHFLTWMSQGHLQWDWAHCLHSPNLPLFLNCSLSDHRELDTFLYLARVYYSSFSN